ncbi:MAG: Verru_Chthon cassette protein C [Candidatus Methylacidiphilales bacterium]|nr:Verru_Chthon cassette protein C [Candidatus Methylacidiphilales bacterium]
MSVRTRRLLSPVRGFTLVELMAAMVILSLLLGIIFTMVAQTSDLWKSTRSKIATFQNSRAAFEAITRNLGQATLNTYYDYYDKDWKLRDPSNLSDPTDPASSNFVPAYYGRRSELQYISGPVGKVFTSAVSGRQGHVLFFQAPLGRVEDGSAYGDSASLLNALGYYVEYSSNAVYEKRPKFLQATPAERPRYQLIECVQPAEKLRIFDPALVAGNPKDWFITPVASGDQSRVMAENIVALIIQPRLTQTDTTLAPDFFYTSRPATYDKDRSHLLPPIVQVTLVAIDDESALRLQNTYGTAVPPLMDDTLFQLASKYTVDLQTLENRLNGKAGGPRLNYRIFSTTVNLRLNK